MTNGREILFSVREGDFEFICSVGSGKGGQKRNKTSTKVMCKHRASGAYAYSDKTRSQHQNKRDAFSKCVSTPEFQLWMKLEISKKAGELQKIQDEIDRSLNNDNETIVETVNENGEWENERERRKTEEVD